MDGGQDFYNSVESDVDSESQKERERKEKTIGVCHCMSNPVSIFVTWTPNKQQKDTKTFIPSLMRNLEQTTILGEADGWG